VTIRWHWPTSLKTRRTDQIQLDGEGRERSGQRVRVTGTEDAGMLVIRQPPQVRRQYRIDGADTLVSPSDRLARRLREAFKIISMWVLGLCGLDP
jgi:hypothetical protein